MSNPKIFLQPELIEGDNIDIAQDGKTISSNTPLENITDTEITEVEDGQALIYDETSGKWVNGEGGTPIEPNPAAAATDTLSTIKIDNTVFSIGGGGTGDAVLYPLTTAEYNALTPEQKMDENVLYLLTDGGSGGGGGGTGSGYSETVLWENASGQSFANSPSITLTLNDDILNYDMLMFELAPSNNPTWRYHNIALTQNIDKTGTNSFGSVTIGGTEGYAPGITYIDETSLSFHSWGQAYSLTIYKIMGIKFGGGGGSNVIPNPEDETTDVLNSIKIDDTTYAIQGGGSFIDVENRIVAPTEFTTSLTYTATEDCVVCMYLVCPGDASTFVKINDFTVQNFWQAELATGPCAPIFVRAGQTLTVTGAHTTYTSNYTVYGVQSSGGGGSSDVIPNPQGTATDTLNTVEIDGTIYDIASGSGSDVSVDSEYNTGTLLATISVDDVDHEIYVPDLYSAGEGIDITNGVISSTISAGASYGYLDPNANFGADKDIYIKYIGDNVISEWMNGGSFKPPTQHATYDIENSFGRDISNDYEIKIINVTIGSWTILVSDITTSWTIKEGSWDTGFSGIRINPSTNRYELHTDYSTPHTLQYKTNDFKPISIDSVWHKTDETWHKDNSSKVIVNPEDAATDVLTKLSVDGDVYGIPEINVEDVYINGTSALDENNIAQIKSYKEITKAEYDALPASKLTDDILYCITDGGATKPGEYFNPVIYSDTEREIGVWTDGKPLYQKTRTIINDELWANGTYYGLAINDVDFIAIKETKFVDTSNSVISDLPYHFGNNYIEVGITGENKNLLRIITNTTFQADNNRYITATVIYTKTTDTPGSGKYTTLGVPSVHYSTDEQVVGTWIDGKPLYQKSFIISPLTINTTKTALPSSILTELSDIDTCISGFCVRHKSEGVTSNATPLSVWIDGSTMYVYSIVQCSNMTHFTFQYTKTTD